MPRKKPILPTKYSQLANTLIADLEKLNLTPKSLNKSYYLLMIISEQHARKNGTSRDSGDGYIQIPQTYFCKVFTAKYFKILTPLIDAGVIQLLTTEITTGAGNKLTVGLKSKDYGIPHSYRINPKYNTIYSETTKISCTYKLYKRTEKACTIEVDIKTLPPVFDRPYVIKQLEKLTINTDNIIKALPNIITANIDSIIKDSDVFPIRLYTAGVISYSYILDKPTFNEKGELEILTQKSTKPLRAKSFQDLIFLADCGNKDIIIDGSRIYLGNKLNYIKAKRIYLTVNYTASINSLADKNFRASRNVNNHRLDTNLTNLPGEIVEIIKEDNNLSEIDMSCCQPLLLGKLASEDYPEDKNIAEYYKTCEAGKIYNMFGPDRNKTKKTFIISMFGKQNNNNIINDIYPTLNSWINEVKSQGFGLKPHAVFAQRLQRLEAELFIDGIMSILIEKGFNVLTKHDSIICESEHTIEIRNIMKTYLSTKGINGQLKIT